MKTRQTTAKESEEAVVESPPNPLIIAGPPGSGKTVAVSYPLPHDPHAKLYSLLHLDPPHGHG